MTSTDRRSPTMFDVAQLAGVSHQTVSRVLNGNPRVNAELRERVQIAVQQLGYRPNPAARSLVTRRTMNLGVVSTGTSQFGPTQALFGIAAEARDAGYATSLVSLEEIDRDSMRAALDHLTADAVDGIIVLAPIAAASLAVEGLTTPVPLVMFEPAATDGRATVSLDEVLAAQLATRHLLDLGHDTVHHISGPSGWLGTDARIRGWMRELSASRRVVTEPVQGDWSAASGYRACLQLLGEPDVTAVFAANDQMALGAIRAAAESGRRIPEDLSIVGLDDIPESAYLRPPLTTVKLDFAEVGRRCVHQVVDLIRRHEPQSRTVVEPLLVVRSSSGHPAVARTSA